MREVLPGVPQVAVFDTAFHSTLPPKSYLYGLPYEYYEKYGVRRYGFHGTSHKFVAEKAAKMIGRDWKELNIISCHLGSGASICAIKQGKSFDTTMGMTPLEGLLMGSRPGDVDPGVIEFIIKKEITENGKDWKDITKMLNKQSGLVGISGGKQDMRDIRLRYVRPACETLHRRLHGRDGRLRPAAVHRRYRRERLVHAPSHPGEHGMPRHQD